MRGSLSRDECFAALKGWFGAVPPGVDGFPMEFYLVFWDFLGEDLVSTLNSCYELGHMSRSQ